MGMAETVDRFFFTWPLGASRRLKASANEGFSATYVCACYDECQVEGLCLCFCLP